MKAKIILRLFILLMFTLMLTTACNNNKQGDEGWITREYSPSEMDDLQKQVNEGHRPGLLDPYQVAMEFLSEKNEIEVDQSYETETILASEEKYIIQYKLTDGRFIQLELIQPSEKGPLGIYTVSRYRFIDK